MHHQRTRNRAALAWPSSCRLGGAEQQELIHHLHCISRALLCCESGCNEAVGQAIAAYVVRAPLLGYSLGQPNHSSFGLQNSSEVCWTCQISTMLPLQSHDIPAPLTSKAPTPNATAICLVPFTPVPLNAPTYSPLGLTSRLNLQSLRLGNNAPLLQ